MNQRSSHCAFNSRLRLSSSIFHLPSPVAAAVYLASRLQPLASIRPVCRIITFVVTTLLLILLVGCQKKKTVEERLTLPRGKYDTTIMANGAVVSAEVHSLESTNDALTAALIPASYELHFTLNVAIPTPATTLATLSAATPDIEKALPDLKSMLFEKEQPLKPSPHYTTLYQNKIKALNNHLSHLDQLLSRQLLYDCQTILPLTNPKNGFKALLVQAMMNVNTDGSDGDRNIPLEKLSPSYQPQTNYRWPKKSSHPNPNSRDLEVQLALKEIALKEPLVTSEQKNKLQQQINTSKTMIAELQRWSFLIGSADPFIVLPKFMLGEKNGDAALGDYAVVLYQETLYPAVVGDIGPSTKLGEASLRLCRALDPRSGALHRPMEAPHVSYFVFPGSAEHPLAAPDYKHWSERCHQLWGNLGGSPNIPWHEWENLEQPWPEEKQ